MTTSAVSTTIAVGASVTRCRPPDSRFWMRFALSAVLILPRSRPALETLAA